MRCYACFKDVVAGTTRCPYCTSELNGFGVPPGTWSKPTGLVYNFISWAIIAMLAIVVIAAKLGYYF